MATAVALSTPTIEDMVQRARALLPRLRERAAATEALGRPGVAIGRTCTVDTRAWPNPRLKSTHLYGRHTRLAESSAEVDAAEARIVPPVPMF